MTKVKGYYKINDRLFSEGKTYNSKAKAYYNIWLRSKARSLSDVYGKYSKAKEDAYYRCLDLEYHLDGSLGRILTHNCQYFTFGFIFTHPETRELWFAVITPTYRAACPIYD